MSTEKRPFISLEQAQHIIEDVPTRSISMMKKPSGKMPAASTRPLPGTPASRNILP